MKFISYLLVAAIAFGAAFFIFVVKGVGVPEYDLVGTGSSYVEQESTSYSSYYEQLTDYQKQIYNALIGTVAEADPKIVLTNVNITEFRKNCYKAVTAIQYDHPEYFWYTGGYSITSTHVAFEELGEIEFEPYYYEYVTQFFNDDAKSAELDAAVNKVADFARQHSSDPYEQIVFVHDYLIENAYYDHDRLKEYYRTSHDPSCEYIFSAYGCLVEGRTVCSGYAKAFQLVTQRLGFECTYVTGDAGERHGWNCIYLDGEGYYVDVTWDDPDLTSGDPFYDYAFITSEALERTHEVDMEFDAPVCNATEYNYFIRRGYYAQTYQFDTVSAIFGQQAGNSAVYVQFGSLAELENAYNDLIRGRNARNIPSIQNYKEYYYNEDHRSLTFIL